MALDVGLNFHRFLFNFRIHRLQTKKPKFLLMCEQHPITHIKAEDWTEILAV